MPGKPAGSCSKHIRTDGHGPGHGPDPRRPGAEKINYYGFSYGTFLGQVYATMFPGRVRRMVLDGAWTRRATGTGRTWDQDIAFEPVAQKWFRWIAKYRSVYHLGDGARQVEKRYYRAQAALRAHPAGGVVGPSKWTDAFTYVAYNTSTWVDLASVFAGWVHDRDSGPLIDAYLCVCDAR